MSSWTRTDENGHKLRFATLPDQRGNVTLTLQEFEGLMRTGGWTPLAEDGPTENTEKEETR